MLVAQYKPVSVWVLGEACSAVFRKHNGAKFSQVLGEWLWLVAKESVRLAVEYRSGDAKRVKSEPGVAAAAGPPSDDDIVAALRHEGPMPSSALTALFRARLATPADRKAFTAAVKRVAKREEREGKKGIVLRGG